MARVASVKVIENATEAILNPNAWETLSRVRIKMKKSNAPSVQPRNAAATTSRALFKSTAEVSEMQFPSRMSSGINRQDKSGV